MTVSYIIPVVGVARLGCPSQWSVLPLAHFAVSLGQPRGSRLTPLTARSFRGLTSFGLAARMSSFASLAARGSLSLPARLSEALPLVAPRASRSPVPRPHSVRPRGSRLRRSLIRRRARSFTARYRSRLPRVAARHWRSRSARPLARRSRIRSRSLRSRLPPLAHRPAPQQGIYPWLRNS